MRHFKQARAILIQVLLAVIVIRIIAYAIEPFIPLLITVIAVGSAIGFIIMIVFNRTTKL